MSSPRHYTGRVRRKEPEQRALQASMIGIKASSPKSQKWHCQKKSFISSRLIANFAISPVPLVMLTALPAC